MPPIIINPSKKIEKVEKNRDELTEDEIIFLKSLLSFVILMLMAIIVAVNPRVQLTWFKVTSGYEKPAESKIRMYEYYDMVDEIIRNIRTVINSNDIYMNSLYNTYDDFDKSATQIMDYMKKFKEQEWNTHWGILDNRLTMADKAYMKLYKKEEIKFDVPEVDNKEKYFMNGITAFIDKMDRFISRDNEFINKLDENDYADFKTLHKKMNQLLANGRQLLRTVMEVRKKADNGVDN